MPGDVDAVTSPQPGGSPQADLEPTNQEQERERRKPEILDEDLNDDDVSVDDRLDVASLGDGSDDELIKSADEEDDHCAASPFARDVNVPPENPPDDVIQEQGNASRSPLFDDQVGSLIFTNQVRPSFGLNYLLLWKSAKCIKLLLSLLLLFFIPSVVKIPRVKNKVKNSV